MNDLVDVVVNSGAQAKQLRPFLRRWNNPARVDSRAKHANLSLPQLHFRVVSRTHPLRRQDVQRIKYRIYTNSFRFVKFLGRPQNTGCDVADTLLNSLAPGSESVYSQMCSRKWQTWYAKREGPKSPQFC